MSSGVAMNSDSISKTRDLLVLQLITRLVSETDRLIRLADDISQHASTPQSKSAMNLIGSEVGTILQTIKATIHPLYNLYEIDSGLRQAKLSREAQQGIDPGAEKSLASSNEDYDETALWADVCRYK